MGRRKGSKNRSRDVSKNMVDTGEITLVDVSIVNDDTYPVTKNEPEKKESYIERYNRPLPFQMRPFCFGALHTKEA